jgi:hypothetical protein
MSDKAFMVQRIAGKDGPPSSSDAVQGSKRQDEKSAQERAAKFRSMLGPGGQREAEAAEAARKAAGQAEGMAGGKTGPGSAAELAAAAKEMQAALEEMGMKASQAKAGKPSGEEGGGDAALNAQLANAASASPAWARPEGPARVEAASRVLPTELEGMEKMHRLLIGQGPAGAEARLAITDGPLAGAQIHLRTGPGGIQAAVSSSTESSRQTLVTAMDEVARRMKEKGHRLTVRLAPPPTRPEHSNWPNQRG